MLFGPKLNATVQKLGYDRSQIEGFRLTGIPSDVRLFLVEYHAFYGGSLCNRKAKETWATFGISKTRTAALKIEPVEKTITSVVKSKKAIQKVEKESHSLKKELKCDRITGYGTITFRGIARLCGVAHTALVNDSTGLEGGNFFNEKLREMLAIAGLEGGNFMSWTTDGIPDKAAAIIIEYYAYEAGARCTVEASKSFRLFAAIGIRSWIQNELEYKPMTGGDIWTLKNVLDVPITWERMFPEEFFLLGEQATGWKRSNRCFNLLFKKLIYGNNRMPKETMVKIDELNPNNAHGRRAKKLHQYFKTEALELIQQLIINAMNILRISTSWAEVQENTKRYYDNIAQLSLRWQ